MDIPPHFRIHDTTIEGEELMLPEEGRVVLAHNAHFVRCRIHFRSKKARSVTIAKSSFRNCEILADRPLRKVDWHCSRVENCVFHGHFYDNRFGYWPVPGFDPMSIYGALERCDFRDAQLHFCDFYGCDMRQMKLPQWPCFTIIDPIATYEEFGKYIRSLESLPEWLTRWCFIFSEEMRTAPPELVGISFHAPSYAKFMSRNLPPNAEPCTEAGLLNFLNRCKNSNVVM